MSDICKWCIHNPYAPHCDSDGNCDFKTLPYTKDAILERLKAETDMIKDAKKKLVDTPMDRLQVIADDEVRRIVDATKGMQIMVDRLIADFGMTEKELKDTLEVQKDSFMTRAKMAAKLSSLKKARGKKS